MEEEDEGAEPEDGAAGDPGRRLDGESPGLLGFREAEDGEDDGRDNADPGRDEEDRGDAQELSQRADEEGDGQGAEAEEDAEDVEGGAASLAFVKVARQGVRAAVEPAPAEAEDDRRREDGPVARGPGEQEERQGDENGRDGQERLEAEAVGERAEKDRRDEHGEVHGQEQAAGRARPEPYAVEERGQDGPQDGHDDAEDEDPGPGRGLEPGRAGRAGPVGPAHGRPPFVRGLRAALNGRA